MWFILQSAIMFAVLASNIKWHWTPNGYVAGLLAYIAAFLATQGLSAMLSYLDGLFADKRTIGRARVTDGIRNRRTYD